MSKDKHKSKSKSKHGDLGGKKQALISGELAGIASAPGSSQDKVHQDDTMMEAMKNTMQQNIAIRRSISAFSKASAGGV